MTDYIPTIYIAVNGIKARPSDDSGWTDRFVTWTHKHGWDLGYWAEKYEYWSSALLRRFKQQDRAETLARMLVFYEGWNIRLVAHSNGGDVVLRALQLTDARIDEIHLISPACESDPKINGLNRMVGEKRIGKLRIYIAGQDKAMKVAKFSQKAVGWLGLGYGNLGGLDPFDARQLYGNDTIVYQEHFGHSTWFAKGTIFENTMNRIIHDGRRRV